MSIAIVSVVLGSMVLLNIAATALLARSDVATPLQKTAQVIFIWVVPLIGSIIVIALLKETNSFGKVPEGPDAMGRTCLPGIGLESGDSSGIHHGHEAGGGDVGHGGDSGFGGD
jgi:hypothetical protein